VNRREDIAVETDDRRPVDREQVRCDDVLDVRAAKEQLVGLRIGDLVVAADTDIIVLLREEARSTQHDRRQPACAGEQLTEVLGGQLADAINIPSVTAQLLRHPCSRRIGGGLAGQTEGTRRAREHERAHARRYRALEQHQRTGDVRVDELVCRVRGEMRFVQRGSVQHRCNAVHGVADEAAIGNRADGVSEWRRVEVDAPHVASLHTQAAHQCFTEMSTAAGDKDGHRR